MHSLPGIVAVSPKSKRCLALFSLVVMACILCSSGMVKADSDIDIIDESPSPSPAPLINDALVKSARSDTFGAQISSSLVSAVPSNYYDTSEYLMGQIVYSVIFLESNGDIDASSEDWSQNRINNALSKINNGIQWWADQYPYPYGKISFVSTSQTVEIDYEPITRSSDDESLWISQAMSYLGFSGTDYSEQVYDYINSLRDAYSTDWCFVVFVVDSLNDGDGMFTDDYCAYAYLGGPFMVLTYDNDGWGINRMDQVAAHEFGHIFYAEDEYDSYSYYSGYLNARETTHSSCIMDDNSWAISSGTKLQVGWRDSDDDGRPDIIDTFPTSSFDMRSAEGGSGNITLTGTASDLPYPNNNPSPWCSGNDISINSVSIWFRVDRGAWSQIGVSNGAFQFSVSITTAGTHAIEIYAVNSVNNQQSPHSIFYYTVLSAEVDQTCASSSRIDVGSTVQLGFHLIWAHNSSSLTTGTISTNCGVFIIGDDGWANFSMTSSLVEAMAIQITQVTVGNTPLDFDPNYTVPTIIWDQLDFFTISANDTHVDPEAPVLLKYGIRYAFDGAIFDNSMGSVVGYAFNSINNLWERAICASIDVGMTNYDERSVTIIDDQYQLTVKKDSSGVDVITDTLNIRVSANASRIGIGSTFAIYFDIRYAYDGATFNNACGNIDGFYWNNDGSRWHKVLPSLDSVGIADYDDGDIFINESKYGIKSRQLIQSASAITDIVDISLDAPERIEAGSTANISWHGHYRFDNLTFTGTVLLNDSIISYDSVGKYSYTVSDITDPANSVDVFSSNTVSIVFDRLNVTFITPLQFGIVGTVVEVKYEYDASPVTDADVLVNNMTATYKGDGRYEYSTGSFMSSETFSVAIEKAHFSPISTTHSAMQTGNITIIALVLIAIALASAVILTKLRKKNRAVIMTRRQC